jgi:hypothetical protein
MITITETIINANITIVTIITISPQCAHICKQLVGSEQLTPLENLSWRSALPKIQLCTFLAESQTAIINTMNVRHHEISSRRPCK